MNQHETDPRAIIQARLGSTRLKGKVLKEIDGQPLLEHVVRRTHAAVPEPILVLPDSRENDPLEEAATEWPCTVVRGPEQDVLGRFAVALEKFPNADPIIRVTGDNPFISSRLMELSLQKFKLDWGTFDLLPLGAGAGVFRRRWLEKANSQATGDWAREHVTPWIKQHSEATGTFWFPPDEYRAPGYRLTVDTEQDLRLARKILGEFSTSGWQVPVPEIIELLDKNPELLKINSRVPQKNHPESRTKILFCLNRGEKWGHGHWERAKFITERLAKADSTSWIFLLLGDVAESPLELKQKLPAEERFPANPRVIKHSTRELEAPIIKKWRRRTDANVVILDRKFSSGELIRAMKKDGTHVLGIEERGSGREHLDAVFDPNLYPDSLEQETVPPDKRFYGPDYAFLNPDFKKHAITSIPKKITDIGLSFGGTDPRDISDFFISKIAPRFPERSFHHFGPEAAEGYSKNVNHEGYVEQPSTAFSEMELMVISGGLTKFEVACLGLPALIIAQNEEQYENSLRFIQKNELDWPLFHPKPSAAEVARRLKDLVKLENWKQIRENTQEVVDGQATDRLAEFIKQLEPAEN